MNLKTILSKLCFAFGRAETLTVLSHLFFPIHSHAEASEASVIKEQVLMVKMPSENAVRLQVTLLIPPGEGKFPIAFLNHGKNIGNAHDQGRWLAPYAARYFLSRGYAVVIPMLQGFAGSDGDFDESSCNAEADGLKNAQDIQSVILQISKDARFDSTRIAVLGQSYGGFNTLALGSLGVPGVRALVNFSGVRHQPACHESEVNQLMAMIHFAKKTRAPSIWFYGANDRTIPEKFARSMLGAYQAAGGAAKLEFYGNFSENSHAFLNSPQALQIWSPILDEFLASQGLPTLITRPELLPEKYPASTGYAKIDDVNAVPYLTIAGKKNYLEFLKKPLPKVAVISTDGAVFYSYGGYDPLSRALSNCLKMHSECAPYAVDNETVWSPRAR